MENSEIWFLGHVFDTNLTFSKLTFAVKNNSSNCILGETETYEFRTHVAYYRSGTVNSNTVNSNFHPIRSYCEIFFYHFPNISCCTVYSNFHLIRSKTLLTNDFELSVPDLYHILPFAHRYRRLRTQKSTGNIQRNYVESECLDRRKTCEPKRVQRSECRIQAERSITWAWILQFSLLP